MPTLQLTLVHLQMLRIRRLPNQVWLELEEEQIQAEECLQ